MYQPPALADTVQQPQGKQLGKPFGHPLCPKGEQRSDLQPTKNPPHKGGEQQTSLLAGYGLTFLKRFGG